MDWNSRPHNPRVNLQAIIHSASRACIRYVFRPAVEYSYSHLILTTNRSQPAVVLWHASRAGAAIRVVFATSGESNPWPQRAAFRKWTIGERERRRWAALRRREARSALRALGVDETCAFFLKFPDYALTDLLVRNQAALQHRLRMHIEAFRPTMLFAPSLSDLHPDHNVLALHTGYALERSAVKDVLDLRYRIHGGSVAGPSGKIHHLVLGEPALAARRRARGTCHTDAAEPPSIHGLCNQRRAVLRAPG